MRGLERPALATLVLLVIQVALDATIVSRRAGHALAEQIARSELEEARRAVLEERTRIAREMHDVVAHHMSLIAVQAETAPYRVADLSAGAKEEFAALSATAREALNDLRRLLGVLRSDRPAERDPQPQLARRRDARRGDPARGSQRRALDAGERQHGGLPRGRALRLPDRPGGALERGPPRARRAGASSRWSATARRSGSTSSTARRLSSAKVPAEGARPGHGIAGMRERVAILGGSISAGPNAVGGFAVSAVLPLTEAAS